MPETMTAEEWLASDEGWEWQREQRRAREDINDPRFYNFREADHHGETDDPATWSWEGPWRWWPAGRVPAEAPEQGRPRDWQHCAANFLGAYRAVADDGADPARA